jgi:hypothetical protein
VQQMDQESYLESAGFIITDGEERDESSVEYSSFEFQEGSQGKNSELFEQDTAFAPVGHESIEKATKKSYRFNFFALEDEVNKYYQEVRSCESDIKSVEYSSAVGHLYKALSDLTYGIFCVNPPFVYKKRGLDPYNHACNHALDIVDRVRSKTIDWDPSKRQAWTSYLKLSTRYFYTVMPTLPEHTTKSLDQVFEEIEAKLNDTSNVKKLDDSPSHVTYQDNSQIVKNGFSDQLYVLLRAYCPEDRIFQLMPLAISSIKYNFEVNKEVTRFKCLLLNLIKRLSAFHHATEHVEPSILPESLDQSVVTLLLLNFASYQNQNSSVPFDLVSSLDFHSLMRLAATSGGKVLRIPTVRELETVIASSVAMSSMLLDGTSFKEARMKAKNIIGFRSNVRSLNRFMKSMRDCLRPENSQIILYLNKTNGDSFLSDLIKSFKTSNRAMTKILDRMEAEIASLTPEQLLEYLKTLDTSEKKLLSFLERMINIKDLRIV